METLAAPIFSCLALLCSVCVVSHTHTDDLNDEGQIRGSWWRHQTGGFEGGGRDLLWALSAASSMRSCRQQRRENGHKQLQTATDRESRGAAGRQGGRAAILTPPIAGEGGVLPVQVTL